MLARITTAGATRGIDIIVIGKEYLTTGAVQNHSRGTFVRARFQQPDNTETNAAGPRPGGVVRWRNQQ